MRLLRKSVLVSLALALTALAPACSEEPEPADDTVDAGEHDAHVATPDAATPSPDSGTPDAQQPDAAPLDAGAPDAPPSADAGYGCPAWLVDQDDFAPAGATASATIAQGTLTLTSQGDGQGSCGSDVSPCDDIKVYQKPLQGDFEVTVEVDGVDGAAAFGGLSLFLAYEGSFDSYAAASILGGTGAAANLSVEQHLFGSNTQQAKFASSTHGTLRARRVGNLVTIAAEVDGAVLEKANISMSGDVLVGIGLDVGFVATPVTGRVTSFTVSGGGGSVASDTFDCDATL